MRRRESLGWIAGVATLWATSLPALSHHLIPPAGEIVLTVTGDIGRTNRAGAAVFDLAALDRLPQKSFVTSTIWTDRPHRYSGVLLADLLDHVAAGGRSVEAIALNDYRASLPLSEITDEAPLLAYRIDGTAMSVRDKGPIWVIYPFDADPAYRTEAIYSRAVWQLVRIVVHD
jgi:hypothetical protein